MGTGVNIIDNTKKIGDSINKSMTDAFVDIVLDVKRVSSQSAPHDSGKLEKNKHTIKTGGGKLEGEVWFEAENEGFDYAKWTHNGDYELGEQSKRKTPGKSKYGNGSVPVGPGYLSNTIEQSRKGYMEHLEEVFGQFIE